MSWVRFAAALHPTVLAAMQATLEAAGIHVRRSGSDLEIEDTEAVKSSRAILKEFLECHAEVMRQAKLEGVTVEMYKPLEPGKSLAGIHRAVLAVSGTAPLADRLGRLVHELIWAQGLSNTNHRSSLLLLLRLVQQLEGRALEALSFAQAADAFMAESKQLVPEQEFAPDPQTFKRRHQDRTIEFVRDVLA